MNKSLCALFLAFAISGCAAAVQTSREYKDLDLNSNLERPIFLSNQASRTLHLALDCPVVEWQADFKTRVAQGLAAKGYTLTDNQEQADLVMIVQVRQGAEMQKTSAKDVKDPPKSSIGANHLIVSGVSSATTGHSVNPIVSLTAGAVGWMLQPIGDVTINQWVYLGTLEIDALIHVKETNPTNQAEFKVTESRAMARARQANMKWEEVSEPVEAALVKQLVSALPKKN